ncbi:MAG: hypothetical protein RJB61_349 [Actinomycetota bacterium]|jgi:uncharacterized protein (TIGR03083 family)
MIPIDTIRALEQCWSSIDALCATLTEEQWKTATDLPGWSVQDNLSHLVAIERMMAGHAPTEHRAADLSNTRNPIGEHNEHEVDVRRSVPGATVFSEWQQAAAERLEQLRSADDAYFDAPAMTPVGPGTVADFLHVRVLDCWVHEQDMRRAVGRTGNLSGPAAELTVDRLLRTVPMVVGKRAATPEGQAVVLEIVGGVQRSTTCEVTAGRAAVVDRPSAPPLCHIRLDVEAFVVLATGRRLPSDVSADVTGDAQHAATVLQHLNMMI